MADDKDYWPEMDRALPALAGEMPNEVAAMANRKLRPMNRLEKALWGRSAAALTYPNGTVTYNRPMADAAKIKPEDLLAHELKHVGQINKRGLLGQLFQLLSQQQPYMQRPDEIEAYAQERKHFGNRRRTTDVQLPTESRK